MSEPSDDALPLAAKDQALASLAGAAPSDADADDVEVTVQAHEDEELPTEPRHDSVPPPAARHDSTAARHDSVAPTSRKLAPPPKPKRDSQPAGSGSSPPPPHDGTPLESLRAIGEALSKDTGAFSISEAVTGSRLKFEGKRPSEPPRARDKTPTIPDEPGAAPSAVAPSAKSIFATRLISVGVRSERPPLAAPPPAELGPEQAPPPPPPPLPPPVQLAPERPPPPPPPPVELAPERPPPPPPPPVELAPERPPPPPPPPVELMPTRPPLAPAVVVDDEAPPDIPITTDEEVITPPAPRASSRAAAVAESLDAAPALAVAPAIPSEPTPAPPLFEPVAPAPAAVEPASAEERAPDSVDRLQVEELSREDSPSLPPEEASALEPLTPSVRAEAKPPPPPKRAPGAAREAPAEAEKPSAEKKAKQKRAWWEELFSEDFVRANWKVSDEQIKREVTFVEESLGVAAGGVVLDLGCGSGQHAVELASRGYGVVGYDLSLYQLALAADIAQERSQKLNFLQGDMREMAFEEMFDGIFCWNTSFGYFEEDKNFSVAERVFRALRPGGMFLVDVINRDFVAAHTPSSVWFEGDSCVCMDDAVIDYFTSRLRVKRSVILDDGRTRECTYSVRLYSFHELGKLLHEVGFRVTEVSGHPATPGVFLGQASPRILMLAQRP
jgi:SAM-dependent methyltransferase